MHPCIHTFTVEPHVIPGAEVEDSRCPAHHIAGMFCLATRGLRGYHRVPFWKLTRWTAPVGVPLQDMATERSSGLGWSQNLGYPQFLADRWFETFFIFPYIGNRHPNWLIFFRGVETTNQLDISGNFNGERKFSMVDFGVLPCRGWTPKSLQRTTNMIWHARAKERRIQSSQISSTLKPLFWGSSSSYKL